MRLLSHPLVPWPRLQSPSTTLPLPSIASPSLLSSPGLHRQRQSYNKTKQNKTMMAPMDSSASTPGTLAPSSTITPASPCILQLFPFPGNNYESARYYYNSTAYLTKGDFGVVLASALAHGHPVTVHEC